MNQANEKQKKATIDRPQHKGSKPKKIQKSLPDKPVKPFVRLLVVAFILFFTYMAYFPSLHNDLLKTWDDQAYVTKNELVKSISGDNILKIFKEDRGLYANYHPMTTLSLAFNYHFSKENPFGYHLTNLLLHLLNTLLVFLFISILTKRNLVIAAVSSLLFGLSPIHVESVAWISERKDVLYALFFLSSMIAYLQFLRKSDWKFYALSVILFLCSLLSKAMAASLPLVLILIDYIEHKNWSWKSLLIKVPYFLLAILLGLYAIKVQVEGNAIGSITFPLFTRILHACFGFEAYLLKILVPTGLSAFYPYPYPLINAGWITNTIPVVFYLTLLLTIVIFCFSIYTIVSGKKNLEILGFGLLFYTFTIALVLQFFPVGRAIMADRYTYIPSIGLFFLIGYYAYLLYEKRTYKIPLIVVVIVYAGFLFFLTREQTRVWKNDETLWNNVIRKYPSDNRIAIAYANRAQYFQLEDKSREALNDLLVVSSWNQKDDKILEKIGKIYGKDLQDLESSMKYFLQAYQVNPTNFEVIKDLATVYGIKGDLKKSLEYSFKGLQIDKNDAFLLYNVGVTYNYLGEKKLSEDYIKKAIKIDPSLNQK